MTTILLKLTFMVITAMIGIAAAQPWLRIVSTAKQYEPSSVAAIPVDTLTPVPLYSDDAPLYDPAVDYARTLKVKLLQTGEYHADEVPYRSGETWLGLIRCGDGSYELRRTTVFIETLENDSLFDRAVTTSTKCESVFLLRGASDLQLGDVETQFDSYAAGSVATDYGTFLNEEFAYFERSIPKIFGTRGTFWKLWVENPVNPPPHEFLQKNSALLLSASGANPQVLRTLPDGCDDCGWSVKWVGDLDRDGQLDFLIDVSGHYNSYQPTLFLSSAGKYGSIGIFAAFSGVGC